MVRFWSILLLATLLAGCLRMVGTRPAEDVAETTVIVPKGPTTPEQALAQYVREQLGAGWAGDCDRANVLTDTGKYCARAAGEREGLHAYRLARTFAEPTHWAFLNQDEGIWRLTAIQEIQEEDTAPGVPWPLKVGAQVVVAGTGSCLNIRAQPRPDAPVLNCIRDGVERTVTEGPRIVDGRRWWVLDGEGWAVDNYLRYPDALPARR